VWLRLSNCVVSLWQRVNLEAFFLLKTKAFRLIKLAKYVEFGGIFSPKDKSLPTDKIGEICKFIQGINFSQMQYFVTQNIHKLPLKKVQIIRIKDEIKFLLKKQK
jgi:hypothetical protein